MNKQDAIAFIRERKMGVIATANPEGKPEAALVRISVSDDGKLIFGTHDDARKAVNLNANPQLAAVVGLDHQASLQLEGRATPMTDDNREEILGAYLAVHPDAEPMLADPAVEIFVIDVFWARISDYRPESFGVAEVPWA